MGADALLDGVAAEAAPAAGRKQRVLRATGAFGEPGGENGLGIGGALFSGIITLRYMTPTEPLATAAPDDLRAALRDTLDALLKP